MVLVQFGVVVTGGSGGTSSGEFHHQASDQHKLSPGWQEPGLWRPRWVMDRMFDATEDGQPAREDRVYFKLKNDRTMKVIDQSSRPRLEIFRPKVVSEKKRRLFETEEESAAAAAAADAASEEAQGGGGSAAARTGKKSGKKAESTSAAAAAAVMEEEVVDGTWWWQDASPLKGGKVKLETREGKDKQERILHEGFCEWGVLDGYAARFKVGKIIRYKMTEAGVPLGTYQAGSFILRVNTHRPLVGKEFLAFE